MAAGILHPMSSSPTFLQGVGAAFWSGRSVAVTGATGFLGSNLVATLVDLGSRVVILQRDAVPRRPELDRWQGQVSVVHGDLVDLGTMERFFGDYQVETAFHLAAQTQVGVANDNPLSTFEANIRGTWTLLEAAQRTPRLNQIVVASSDKAYGSQPILPYSEDMALLGVHPYDVSKACTDMISQTYNRCFGLPVCVTRCGNIFGPGDTNTARLVPGTVLSVLQGERPVIRSDGTMTRDYLYVMDCVTAYLQLAETMDTDSAVIGQTFNFSNEEPMTVIELVAAIQRVAGTNLQPDIRATARNEINHQFLSAAKARQILKWEPSYSLDDGLALTISYYRDRLKSDHVT